MKRFYRLVQLQKHFSFPGRMLDVMPVDFVEQNGFYLIGKRSFRCICRELLLAQP